MPRAEQLALQPTEAESPPENAPKPAFHQHKAHRALLQNKPPRLKYLSLERHLKFAGCPI